MAVDVKGLSIQDIMSTYSASDIREMKRSDAAKLTSRLVSAANKRIRGLQGSGVPSHLSKTDKFSTKDKDVNQLAREYTRLVEFLNKKTSSVRGYKSWRKKVETKIMPWVQGTHNKEQYENDFWEAYSKLISESRLFEKYKYEVFKILQEVVLEEGPIDMNKVRKRVLDNLFNEGNIDEDEYEDNINRYSSLGDYFTDIEGNE